MPRRPRKNRRAPQEVHYAAMVVTRWVAACVCAGALLPLPLAALEPVEPVTECMARNAPDKTILQTIEMRAKDRIGAERSIRGKVYWKRFDDGFSRVLAHFSEPLDINGTRLLLIGKADRNDMFLYMPAVRKVRRINSQSIKGNIFGTDFSYEDFERLQGMAGRISSERLADAELDGRAVYVLATKPPPDSGSAYERAISYVDSETCVPIKVELFERGDRLRKVLTADPGKVKREGEIWVPHELVMRDLRDDTETRLLVEDIEVGAEIPDRTFSLTKLERSQ